MDLVGPRNAGRLVVDLSTANCQSEPSGVSRCCDSVSLIDRQETPMRQQLPPQSQPPPEDASQHISPLWSERTQVQPQDPAYSPVVPLFPAEPRPLVLTQPGAGPAQSAEPPRLAELSAIDVAATALEHDLPTDSEDHVDLLRAQFATKLPTRSVALLTEVCAQLADRRLSV
jgi:hypothetical protein